MAREFKFDGLAQHVGNDAHIDAVHDTSEEFSRYVVDREAVVRVPGKQYRVPDLRWAENMAYLVIVSLGLHFPADPKEALRRLPRVNLFTYRRAADHMGMKYKEFQRDYGSMDAFTVRQTTRDGELYWAVAYQPRELKGRERFTLAHELGHVVMDHKGDSVADEAEANYFAGCFLAPRVVLKKKISDRHLSKLCYVTAAQAKARLAQSPQRVDPALERLMALWYQFEAGYQDACRRYAAAAEQMKREGKIHLCRANDPTHPDAFAYFYTDLPVNEVDLVPKTPLREQHLYYTAMPELSVSIDIEAAYVLYRCIRAPRITKGRVRYCPYYDNCPRAENCALDWSVRYSGDEDEPENELIRILDDWSWRTRGCAYTLDHRRPPMRWMAQGAQDVLFFPGLSADKDKRIGAREIISDEMRAYFEAQAKAMHAYCMRRKAAMEAAEEAAAPVDDSAEDGPADAAEEDAPEDAPDAPAADEPQN